MSLIQGVSRIQTSHSNGWLKRCQDLHEVSVNHTPRDAQVPDVLWLVTLRSHAA